MTGRPREFEREDAIDKAMELFWEQGYEATGVAELCDRMGVGRQSLYNTFGDKESLFVEALSRYQQVRLAPMLALKAPPLMALPRVVAWLERIAARPAVVKGMSVPE